MSLAFAIIAAVTLVSAVCAMSFRNIVHCALFLTLTFAGLACFYLQLGAEFVGLAQILVYIGAVAILIVFAILLTRSSERQSERKLLASYPTLISLGVALLVGYVIFSAILASPMLDHGFVPPPDVTVKQIGELLMTDYVLPLEVIALLLTAAMIGAAIIALREPPVSKEDGTPRSLATPEDATIANPKS